MPRDDAVKQRVRRRIATGAGVVGAIVLCLAVFASASNGSCHARAGA
jgi:hypothetical protein